MRQHTSIRPLRPRARSARDSSSGATSADNDALLGAIHALAEAVEAKDPYTAGHTWRVTRYALLLTDHLALSAVQRRALALGGVLHDLGKVAISEAILTKPGRLTEEEFAHMRTHPLIGARIVRPLAALAAGVLDCVEGHHERWDGRGYPHGRAHEDIPLLARIMAVADTYDAITSSRPYQKGRSPAEGVAEIARQRAQQFDPDVTDAWLAVEASGLLDQLWRHSAAGPLLFCVFCDGWIVEPHPGAGSALHVAAGLTTDCPACQVRFQLAVRNGRLEVVQIVALSSKELAYMAALAPHDLAHYLAQVTERMAAADVRDPSNLLRRVREGAPLQRAVRHSGMSRSRP